MVRYGHLIKNIRLAECWNCITVMEALLRNRGALQAIRRFDPETHRLRITIDWYRRKLRAAILGSERVDCDIPQ